METTGKFDKPRKELLSFVSNAGSDTKKCEKWFKKKKEKKRKKRSDETNEEAMKATMLWLLSLLLLRQPKAFSLNKKIN